MITIRKLQNLKENTRKRKYISILRDMEESIKKGLQLNSVYNRDLYNLIERDFSNQHIVDLLKAKIDLRSVNSLRHQIMIELNMEPGEWDLYAAMDSANRELVLPINLYLEDLRSPFNIGSIFRSAECFAVNNIYISKNCSSPTHKRAIRSSMGTVENINWEIKDLEDIKGPIFSLELGGTPINEFNFPQNGTVIIGSEELGVSPEALDIADNSIGRVTIPLYGSKTSLNVASATSILLQKWCEQLLEG